MRTDRKIDGSRWKKLKGVSKKFCRDWIEFVGIDWIAAIENWRKFFSRKAVASATLQRAGVLICCEATKQYGSDMPRARCD